MITIELVYNLSILIALCVFSGFISKRWSKTTLLGKILQGLLFGSVAVFGMLNPYVMSPGTIFDGRSVVLSLGALFFGPVTAVISATITIVARLMIGGGGSLMGVSVITASALIGVLLHPYCIKNPDRIKSPFLLSFGLLVHIVMILLMALLPSQIRLETLQTLGITIIILYPLATIIIGKVLHDQERTHQLFADLKSSEMKFRSLVENAFDAIYLIKNRNYIYVNPSFCEITGYSEDELLSKDFDFSALLSEDGREFMEKRYQARHLGEDLPSRYDIGIITKTGSHKHIEVSTVSLGNNIDILVMGVMRDITQRKQAEEEIYRKNEELRLSNEEKDRLLSIIAHDLRGPIGSFLGLVEHMADENEVLSVDDFRKYSRSIHKSASNAYELLEQLLDWSRIKRSGVSLVIDRIEAGEIIGECIGEVQEMAKHKEISIHKRITEELVFHADRNMLQSILRNLLSNAVKFTHRGGSVSIDAIRIQNNAVEFSVSDNGIGMDQDHLSKLFSFKHQVSTPGTENEPSTGMGLIICRELVEKHNGKIWVESAKGKGSTFYFTIPGLS